MTPLQQKEVELIRRYNDTDDPAEASRLLGEIAAAQAALIHAGQWTASEPGWLNKKPCRRDSTGQSG